MDRDTYALLGTLGYLLMLVGVVPFVGFTVIIAGFLLAGSAWSLMGLDYNKRIYTFLGVFMALTPILGLIIGLNLIASLMDLAIKVKYLSPTNPHIIFTLTAILTSMANSITLLVLLFSITLVIHVFSLLKAEKDTKIHLFKTSSLLTLVTLILFIAFISTLFYLLPGLSSLSASQVTFSLTINHLFIPITLLALTVLFGVLSVISIALAFFELSESS